MAAAVHRKVDDEVALDSPDVPPESDAARPDLLGLLACPACTAVEPLIAESASMLRCKGCNTRFPRFRIGQASVPWLFPNPDVAKLEWNARLRAFLHSQVTEHNRLNRALERARGSPLTRARIEETMRAKRDHSERVESLLTPLGLDGDVMIPGMTRALHDRLPRSLGLTSYINNLFRDWAWNNGENDAQYRAVSDVLAVDDRSSAGAVLTLGAGACRLAYDMHRYLSPTVSVALDMNPLLMLAASRIVHGDTVELYEFPTAPRGDCVSGKQQACQAPAALQTSADSPFHFLLGDATNPPLAARSFDTVVTPWLIDVLKQDLPQFVAQINRLLPRGGVWLNTGSLAFYHNDPLRCYGEKEVFEIVERQGFELIATDHRTIPYLQSPHSAHGRTEQIVTFAARKKSDVRGLSRSADKPEWLIDITQPVPGSPEFVVESSGFLLSAQVLAAVDGRRSVHAIAKMVSREYDLGMDECIHAVASILGSAHDDDRSPPDW